MNLIKYTTSSSILWDTKMGLHVRTSSTVLLVWREIARETVQGQFHCNSYRWNNLKVGERTRRLACCLSIPIWLNKRWRLNQVPEMDDFDQTAVGMMGAIKSSFEQNKLSNLLNKLIYLSADNALATAGESWGWLHNWIRFIWCFSHSLQLALKDALENFTPLVDESLMDLYYLYHKSSKKLRELQYIFKDLQNDFEMYGDDAKSLKSTGIC